VSKYGRFWEKAQQCREALKALLGGEEPKSPEDARRCARVQASAVESVIAEWEYWERKMEAEPE